MQTKICSSCKKDKEVSNYFKSRTQPDGYQSYCKDCNKESSKKWYRKSDKIKSKIQSRKYLLKSKYGMTIEDYNILLDKQMGVCAIFHKEEKQVSSFNGGIDSLRVDHCHKTGKIRGLLCSKCNFALGHIDDSISRSIGLTLYLLKYVDKQNNK